MVLGFDAMGNLCDLGSGHSSGKGVVDLLLDLRHLGDLVCGFITEVNLGESAHCFAHHHFSIKNIFVYILNPLFI